MSVMNITETVSVERPVLLSLATMADFAAWEESCNCYSRCQSLSLQDGEMRLSAARQALDEDLRWFLHQRIIPVFPAPAAKDVISAVQKYLRRQSGNSLLNRSDFYKRNQIPGESFDAFLRLAN